MNIKNVCVKITNEKDRLELLKVLKGNGQPIAPSTEQGLKTGYGIQGENQLEYSFIFSDVNYFQGSTVCPTGKKLITIKELEKLFYDEKLKQALQELEDLKVKIESLAKPKLVIGKWYNYGYCLLCYQGVCDKGVIRAYGFNMVWSDIDNYGRNPEEWKEATKEEVEKSLIEEAKKRGFKLWCEIDRTHFDEMLGQSIIDPNYYPHDKEFFYGCEKNYLEYHGMVIFSNGNWATVVDNKRSKLDEDIQALTEKYPEYNINIIVEGK